MFEILWFLNWFFEEGRLIKILIKAIEGFKFEGKGFEISLSKFTTL